MTQPRSIELASLPNLYLRDSRNRAFLAGKSDTIFPPVSRSLYGAVIGGVLSAVFVFLAGATAGGDSRAALAAFALLVVTGISIARLIRLKRRARRLAREGCLLRGELVSLFTERNFGKRRRGFVFYGKALGYTFLSPDGRRLYAGGDLIALKPGMNPQPEHGMPVAMLYVDDSCFLML